LVVSTAQNQRMGKVLLCFIS